MPENTISCGDTNVREFMAGAFAPPLPRGALAENNSVPIPNAKEVGVGEPR